MTVYFVGAGPGAADLMTLRGQRVVSSSPVCVYAGALVPQEVLSWCPDGAELVDSQHLTLAEIVEVMASASAAGQSVARLHSGDPSVYSAMAEQMRLLAERGIAYEVVPGVPSFAAAAAALGTELTVPEVAQSVVLTRVSRRATAMPQGETLANFGRTGATLVVHLAIAVIDEVVAELVPFYGADCPVAVCGYVSRPQEVLVRGTLASIVADVEQAQLRRTSVIIVGPALTASGFRDSHLYSCDRQLAKRTP